MKKKLSVLSRIFIGIGCAIALLVLIVAGYFITVFSRFYRIDDNQILEINRPGCGDSIFTNKTYKVLTNNIGFGAYDSQYDFFMDDGYADTERKVKIHGTHARAIDKDHVLNNTNSAINTLKAYNADFIFLQEVDINSTRSYHVNQEDLFSAAFSDYSFTKAINYHSSYLCYPLNEPIGRSNSEIVIFSKAKADSSIRRSLPLSESKTDNITDLDRCIMINRFSIENSEKDFVAINVHLSAYDEGGRIRRKQVEFLADILEQERKNGNYVLIGGDFNQILTKEGADYFIKPNGEITPDWVALWECNYPGYKVVATTEGNDGSLRGTARNNTKAYDPNWTYTCVIDGFIVSDNIKVEKIENQTSVAFAYSDHIPVLMEFSLLD